MLRQEREKKPSSHSRLRLCCGFAWTTEVVVVFVVLVQGSKQHTRTHLETQPVSQKSLLSNTAISLSSIKLESVPLFRTAELGLS
jgi:hypothetical protein